MQGDDAKPPEKSLNYKDCVNVFVYMRLHFQFYGIHKQFSSFCASFPTVFLLLP